MKKKKPQVLYASIRVTHVESSLGCGLRVNWARGEDKKSKVDMTAGAGLGSPWLVFTYTDKRTNRTVELIMNANDIVAELAEQAECILAKEKP